MRDTMMTIEALDAHLSRLEACPCPVVASAAEEARDALLYLLDIIAQAEPGTATRGEGN